MTQKEKAHDGAVMRLVDNPPSCIDSVVLSARECNVFDTGTLIKKPDGIYISRSGEISLLEYKTSEAHRKTAVEQLCRSYEVIKQTVGITPRLYYAFTHNGRFKIEEIPYESRR